VVVVDPVTVERRRSPSLGCRNRLDERIEDVAEGEDTLQRNRCGLHGFLGRLRRHRRLLDRSGCNRATSHPREHQARTRRPRQRLQQRRSERRRRPRSRPWACSAAGGSTGEPTASYPVSRPGLMCSSDLLRFFTTGSLASLLLLCIGCRRDLRRNDIARHRVHTDGHAGLHHVGRIVIIGIAACSTAVLNPTMRTWRVSFGRRCRRSTVSCHVPLTSSAMEISE
jgi:hypothetical protein